MADEAAAPLPGVPVCRSMCCCAAPHTDGFPAERLTSTGKVANLYD